MSASEDAGERQKNCVTAEGVMYSSTGAGAAYPTGACVKNSTTGTQLAQARCTQRHAQVQRPMQA